MKIIVSHSQKQHVYRMVFGLKKHKKLQRFFTSIFFSEHNLLTKLFRINKRTKNLVKKRSFIGLDKKDVQLTVLPEAIFQLGRFFMPRLRGYYMDRSHDNMVSWLLPFWDYDMIIGYERQCLKSFKNAKKEGKTTILDLASIHAQQQREINAKYNNILTGYKPSKLLEIEKDVKAEELKHTDYIITLSEFAKDSCIEAGVPKEKIFTVHLGIDVDAFVPKEKYDTETFELLLVGGMRYSKGIEDIVETFEALALPNAVLTLVGGQGDALEYVQQHLSTTIRYIPFLHHDELVEVYRRASVFVLPSYMDSWAQVVCEAMACGTPVIISENTGAKDVVVEDENGFVVPVADKKKLAEKINYFYNNRNEVERMGRNARRAVKHLTWENYYQQIDEIIQEIGNQKI